MDNSILEKLSKAASAEELQSIAKKCGLDKISLDEAKKLFEQLKSKGSISADSLKSIVSSIGGSGSEKKSGSSEGVGGALKGVLGAVEKAAESVESKSKEGTAKDSQDKSKEVREAADAVKDVLGKFKK